jgi:hypothetical protein
MDEESTGRMVIPPVIARSGTRHAPEEYDYVGNYQLIDKKSSQGMGICRE